MEENFQNLFRQAVGHDPYDYQCRLAQSPDWPMAVRVGTGLGKTAAVSLSWIWRRRFANEAVRQQTPRRMVYCLPQRSLVQQTATAMEGWLRELGLFQEESEHNRAETGIPVHVLMGGNLSRDWDTHPEQDMVIIGTQDQLLSRALNRGYGMSRYRWPVHFALLNSDCLWIIDEGQLFSNGLATTAQMQAFRERFGTYGATKSVWISATLQRKWIATVDFMSQAQTGTILELDEADQEAAARLLQASKPVKPLQLTLSSRMASKPTEYAKQLAHIIEEAHVPGTMTLVIVNRVNRAQSVFKELQAISPATRLLLVHSRFRPMDRAQLTEELWSASNEDMVVIATQAIEAGVDISARTLITELAPWSSLIQRFGRCNRYGEVDNASIAWIDLETDDATCLPYDKDEVQAARTILSGLDNARISTLPSIADDMTYSHVLRSKDLVELFDNTPDLSGTDVDVSPYVRDVNDTDVMVYWRKWQGNRPGPDSGESIVYRPQEVEVCRVSISVFKDYLSRRHKEQRRVGWIWDPLNVVWRRLSQADVHPGQVILMHADMGGYTEDIGFDPDSWDIVSTSDVSQVEPYEAHDAETDNVVSQESEWQNGPPVLLGKHLLDVVGETRNLMNNFSEIEETRQLVEAALYHDWGKAVPLFQLYLKKHLSKDNPVRHELLAKSGRKDFQVKATALIAGEDEDSQTDSDTIQAISDDNTTVLRNEKGFRHELASAAGYLQTVPREEVNARSVRLIAYLIAAHHGKVRMAIRSVPTETTPEDNRLFARGVWDGDELPKVVLSNGRVLPQTHLSLQVMRGSSSNSVSNIRLRSWLAGTLDLLDYYGPFRLAWLEAVLRIADWRASEKEAEGVWNTNTKSS